MTQNFHVLSKITAEPPALPPVEHAGAHIINAPLFERKYARVYLGDPESREASTLRRQIAKGAREALEEQYWDVLERTVQARPTEARLGGDPSVANKVRAFLFVRYYRNGEWEDRIEVGAADITVRKISDTCCYSSWLGSLYGLGCFISFAQGMLRRLWMKLHTSNKLFNIVKPALSTTSELGSSLLTVNYQNRTEITYKRFIMLRCCTRQLRILSS